LDKVRSRRIATLTEVQGFNELLEDLDEALERSWTRVLNEQRAGVSVDQREIDKLRGVSEVIRKLRQAPAKTARMIEKAEEAETNEE